MKSTRLYVLAIVALVCIAAVLSRSTAQTGAPAYGTRVAVCDVAQVFDNSTRRKDLNDQFDKRGQDIQAENETRLKAIDDLNRELEGLLPGSEQYEGRLNEGSRLAIERQAWLEHQTRLAERDLYRLTSQMYEDILQVVEQVAKTNGVDMVLYHRGEHMPTENMQQLRQQMELRKVLYASETVDITDTVLLRLNETYKAGKE